MPSHHYGGPQLTHVQHPCRHNNNLMVLCLTHHSTQEVLSQPLYPSQQSVGLQPTTVTITANLLVLSLHMKAPQHPDGPKTLPLYITAVQVVLTLLIVTIIIRWSSDSPYRHQSSWWSSDSGNHSYPSDSCPSL